MVTAHGLVTRKHILEGTRQHMMHTGFSVRSRRPFIENILRPALTLFNSLLKDSGLLPKFQHAFFHRSHVELGIYRFEHSASVNLK
jgi:hypothetical protein